MKNKRRIAMILCLCLMFEPESVASINTRVYAKTPVLSEPSATEMPDDEEVPVLTDKPVITAPPVATAEPEPTKTPSVPAATATPAPTTKPGKKKPALNYTSLELKKGKKKTLKTVNVKGKVTWSSTNSKVATVSSKGVVKGKKEGSAKIRAKYNNGKKTLICQVNVYKKMTPSAVTKKILSMKSKYNEGKTWTNGDYYFWSAIRTHCFGCIAFVGIISDAVFGKNAKVQKHQKFADIRAGDHIRIGGYHSVIVLTHKGNKLTVAEGNYNSSIHWGRTITKKSLMQEGFYVETRY